MSVYHPESSLIGVSADTYNKDIVPTNADVFRNETVNLIPVSADVDSSVIVFNYPGSNLYHIDLSRTFLSLRCQLLNEDGKPLPITSDVYPIPDILNSIWNNRKIFISNEPVKTGDNFSFISYIRNVFSLRFSHKNSLAIGTSLYYEEDYIKKDIASKFKKSASKEFYLYGAQDVQPFTVKKLIPANTPLRFEYYRNSDAFVIHDDTEDSTLKPHLKILEAKLELTCIQPNTKLNSDLEKRLQSENLIFDFLRADMSSYVIQSGIQKIQTAALSSGILPNRVLIFLLEQNRYIGNYKLNPFVFSHFNVNRVSLLLDGHPLLPDLEVNFQKEDLINTDAVKLYYKLYQMLGQDQKETCGVTYEQFVKSMCCFPFDLTPSLTSYNTDENCLQSTGDLSVKLTFDKALDDNIILLMYGEYRSTFELTANRQLFLNY